MVSLSSFHESISFFQIIHNWFPERLTTSSSITFLTFTIGLFISSILILGFTALILGFATSFLLGGGCGLVVDVLVPTSSVVDICIHVVCFGGVTKVKAHDGTSEQAIKVSMTVLLFFILEIGSLSSSLSISQTPKG